MDIWPIDPGASRLPDNWNGWPEGKRFALVLTHDVDTQKGHDRCRSLLELEKEFGFRSSFNFVPKRYDVSPELREFITLCGFEVGVHGLYHDGKYFDSRDEFMRRAGEINKSPISWGAAGFRPPALHHNLEWILDLNILYDASTFDTDPFEPHPDGARTIFPFYFSHRGDRGKGFVELPYTLPQDFTLFILLREKTIDIWKKKLDWIVDQGGMALINTHPDYMSFEDQPPSLEEYPVRHYKDLLNYLENRYKDQYWHVLPKEIAAFWERVKLPKY